MAYGSITKASGSTPCSNLSALLLFVARVAPIVAANILSVSLSTGGNVSSFIIQNIAFTGFSNLSNLLGVHSFDFIALPLPFLISSVTKVLLPLSSIVTPQF